MFYDRESDVVYDSSIRSCRKMYRKGGKRRNGRERNRGYKESRVDRSISRLDDSLAAVIVVIGTRHSSRGRRIRILERSRKM